MASVETTLKIHDEFNDIFTGTVSFKIPFFLQVKDDMKPYQVLLMCIAYAFQQPILKGKKDYRTNKYWHH